MHVIERMPGDRDRLVKLVKAERHALRRDRYRAVLLALDGGEAAVIAETLGRARRSVQDWVYAYRDGGIDTIHPPKRPGRTPKLPREREDELRARLDAGPTEADGVCTLRGRDVVLILEREFGVKYSLDGAYDLLARLGYTCQSPRPRHEKRDPEAQEKFKKAAPLLFGHSSGSAAGMARRSASSSWTRPASASRAR